MCMYYAMCCVPMFSCLCVRMCYVCVFCSYCLCAWVSRASIRHRQYETHSTQTPNHTNTHTHSRDEFSEFKLNTYTQERLDEVTFTNTRGHPQSPTTLKIVLDYLTELIKEVGLVKPQRWLPGRRSFWFLSCGRYSSIR